MKKNGKKYRKIKKEQERKRALLNKNKISICQEVDDINISMLAISHIVEENPILQEKEAVKEEYLSRLTRLVKSGKWNTRKFESSELSAYKKIILDSEKEGNTHEIEYYRYFILFDLFHILGYEIKNSDIEKIELVKKEYYALFHNIQSDKKIVDDIFTAFVTQSTRRLKELMKKDSLKEEKGYITLIRENMSFKKKSPRAIMVTATMSAGKSTFINALVGKYICLSQNMACTSKIHSIINKAFEDGYAYEYDHDLVLTAGKEELLNDNELNTSDKIVVSAKITGELSNERMIINDSPGVNYSENQEHKIITEKLIKRKNYNLLIYIMNATQLGTNDEEVHLEYVKKTVGRTPVLFVVNKIDTFNTEEENVIETVKRQTEYLKKKGFKNPMVCPVSAKAAYLSKQFTKSELSRFEKRELYSLVDKFQEMNLPKYYSEMFKNIKIPDSQNEEEQLLKTSGMAYVEKIIKNLL